MRIRSSVIASPNRMHDRPARQSVTVGTISKMQTWKRSVLLSGDTLTKAGMPFLGIGSTS